MSLLGLEENAFVLDNSIVMAWVFADENDPYALEVLAAMQDHTAIVPPLWMWEITNVLLVAMRRGRTTETIALEFLSELERMKIIASPGRSQKELPALFQLARQNNLTAYDAEYLALAAEMNVPLATSDADLIQAMHQVGVARFAP
jgi:predicted nucleic acid-binding protein